MHNGNEMKKIKVPFDEISIPSALDGLVLKIISKLKGKLRK